MRRLLFLSLMYLFTVLCFAQQNVGIKVIGRIPDATDGNLYQMQVGAFKNFQNASKAFDKLKAASLNPSYEKYLDLTRVLIKGVNPKDVPSYIERIRRAGFAEVFIKIDPAGASTYRPPVRAVEPPQEKFNPYSDPDPDPYPYPSYSYSDPDPDADEDSYFPEPYPEPDPDYYPDSNPEIHPKNSGLDDFSIKNFSEYHSDLKFRLAYRFLNKGENRGASGRNGGIDILGMDAESEWLWTTYYQGGWFYDLNGINREMVDGFQRDPRNGVELTVKPEFVFDEGIYYLQFRHILRNPGKTAVKGQKFGASADVMMNENDDASIIRTEYGAYMTDSELDPTIDLLLFCDSGVGIDPVSSLYMGKYDNGMHVDNIYNDSRAGVRNMDSAIGFSYQNIDLAPGQSKEFIIRFTLVRTRDY